MDLGFNFPNQKFFNVAHVGIKDFFGDFFNKVMGAIASIQTSQVVEGTAVMASTNQDRLSFPGYYRGIDPTSIRIERGGIALKITDPNAKVTVDDLGTVMVSGLTNTYPGEQLDLTAIATTKAFTVYSYYNGGVSFIGATSF